MNEMRKLMETVEQLREEFVEYRDPDGEFQVIYDFPRGYFAVGKNDAKRDISGESFDNLDDAIEHAEICLSVGGEDKYEDQFADEEGLEEEYGIDQDGNSYNVRGTREATVALHELMDEGMLDPRVVADAALTWMSEAEVADMASDNSFFGEALEEDKNSAALHTVNANYAQLKKELAELVTRYKNDQDFDGWYLLEDIESLVERYSK